MISSTIRKAGPFAGTGSTGPFPFTFKVFNSTDVQAVYTSVLGVESPLTAGYTVSLNVDQESAPGGTVTLTTPLAVGAKLTLLSNVAALQPVQITNGGGFFPAVLNGALDRLTILVQQLLTTVSRAVLLPPSENGLTLPTALQRVRTVLGFGADGGFQLYAPGDFKGDPGGDASSVGTFTAIFNQRFDTLATIGLDQITTSGYRTAGRGAARLRRFKAPMATLPASGANAWWTTAADGSIWYADPAQDIDLDMFGAYGDDVNDDYPAWLVANQFCVWRSGYQTGDGGSMGGTLRVPTRTYRSSQAWTITTTMRLVGTGTGMAGGSEQNRNFYIRFTGATDGIVVGAGATGSAVIGLSLLGPSNAPSTYAGVRCLTRATVLFNNITRFGGYGVRCNSNDGGNNNGSYISFNRVTNIGGSGILVQGGDGNAFTIQGNDISGCANWGIEDRSFLGGDISGGQIENCGSIGSGGRTAPRSVSYGGRWWAVLDGQDAAASTTAPGTNAGVWTPLPGSGGVDGQHQAWVSGTTYKAGGALVQSDPNAATEIRNLYVEPDCGPIQILGRAFLNSGGIQVDRVGGFSISSVNGYFTVSTSVIARVSEYGPAGGSQLTRMGAQAFGENNILSDTHSVFGTFVLNHDGGGNIVATVAGSLSPFYVTGALTGVRGGGAGNIGVFALPGFFLSGGGGGPKKWIGGGAPPTTGTWALGDRVWNDASGATSIATTSFWHCTAAGTPGTWAAKA